MFFKKQMEARPTGPMPAGTSDYHETPRCPKRLEAQHGMRRAFHCSLICSMVGLGYLEWRIKMAVLKTWLEW